MSVVRTLRTWSTQLILAAVAVGPIVALCAAAVLDRGPDGRPRASTFPVAIAAFDPFVWSCLRNSVATAGAVAAGATLIGLYVGRLIGDWRFPARPILLAAVAASAVAPPAVVALGIAVLFGSDGGPKLAWTDSLGSASRYVPGDWRWYAWFGSALVQGAAVSTFACVSTLQRFDPAWRDAARLVGGPRGRVWRKLGWPLLRPPLARAAGLVFVLTVAEPGAPLVLGLRRTLGYQIVAAALEDDPFPRTAVLGLIAVFICILVRVLLAGWAGAKPDFKADADRPRRTGSRRRGAVGGLVAALWAAIAGAPVFALVLESVQDRRVFWERLFDPSIAAILGRSALLGAGVGVFLTLLGRLARSLPPASNRSLILLRADFTPPLSVGVAALCLPWLAASALGAVDVETSRGLALLVRRFAAVVGSDAFGAILPSLGVGLATAPALLAVWEAGTGRDPARADRLAAATLASAGRAQARRLASDGSRFEALRRFVLVSGLAATNVAPAILLARRTDDRTLGPAILLFQGDPEFGPGPAATLAVLVLALNVAVVFLCSGTRSGARSGS